MNSKELESKINSFLNNYKETLRNQLSTQPEWKIDSLISELNNIDINNCQRSEKIELIIKENINPFIALTNNLLSNIEKGQTTQINNIISNMTNGKFLDSIGIPNQSEKSETLALIEVFTNELSELKKAANNV